MELRIRKSTFYTLLGILLVLLSYGVYSVFANTSSLPLPTNCIPTFPDGGGPYYYPDAPFRKVLVPQNTKGEKLIVRGKLLKNDCKTSVSNAVLDIWQADETGTYQKDWYRGKVRTDSGGNYEFETVMPKGYGSGTGYRPSHIHFKVFINDKLIITSEMFFPEVQGKPGFNDAYIMKLEKKNTWGKIVNYGYHHIVLP